MAGMQQIENSIRKNNLPAQLRSALDCIRSRRGNFFVWISHDAELNGAVPRE
jgi:hypothetical protein